MSKAARKTVRKGIPKKEKQGAKKPAAKRKAPARRVAAKSALAAPAPVRQDWMDASLPPAVRAKRLVARMTLEEKIGQLMNGAPAIPRLGVIAYNYESEGLHGVGRAGLATVFPQCIGLGATFDAGLLRRVSSAIGDEARAKHHDLLKMGVADIYTGLTYWCPNINIFRDPRWGRGHETFGECPHLSARLGVAYVRGMQGDDPKWLKTVATPKHYAVHSGPEAERHGFNAVVDERDLRETYLPAFKACITEAKAASIMTAYNRVNGEVCSASPTLLGRILRGEWGFDGFVVCDCGAIADIWREHKAAKDPADASAMAVKAGCDLECGDTGKALGEAVRRGLIDERDITVAAERVFTARFRLGMFDLPELVGWAQTPPSVNACAEHRELNRQAARETVVLLKNEAGALPLAKGIGRLLVVGPNADDVDALVGNYNGVPAEPKTVLAGIRAAVSPGTRLVHRKGSGHVDMDLEPREAIAAYRSWRSFKKGEFAIEGTLPPDVEDLSAFAGVVAEAREADAVVAVVGLSPEMEGEQGDGNERTKLAIPRVQERLLEALFTAGKPVVIVLLGGSSMAVGPLAEKAAAVLLGWYPGGEGGAAIADVLFGDENPAGRLPVTFYASEAQLPEFRDYRMRGRTYRYFAGEPLWPFGFGLSYATFAYTDLRVLNPSPKPGDPVDVSVAVTNTGGRAGDEVVQLYATNETATVPVPIRQLAGFARVRLAPGASRKVEFTIRPEHLSVIDDRGKRVAGPATFLIAAGGCQPGWGARSTSGEPVTARFTTFGPVKELEP
jgi:beta-glucosidase